MVVEHLIRAAASLRDDVGPIGSRLVSEGSVDVCYNPLEYAWDVHEAYLERMGDGGARPVAPGLNPGPPGLGPTGAPVTANAGPESSATVMAAPNSALAHSRVVSGKVPVRAMVRETPISLMLRR